MSGIQKGGPPAKPVGLKASDYELLITQAIDNRGEWYSQEIQQPATGVNTAVAAAVVKALGIEVTQKAGRIYLRVPA